MQLRYDDDFLEAAVFLCATGRCRDVPSMQIARFHRERERLYSILDPDDRNSAFFRLHLDWFREWGLQQLLTDLIDGFPLVRENLTVLAVRRAPGKNDEGAEWYVNNKRSKHSAWSVCEYRCVRNSESFHHHEWELFR